MKAISVFWAALVQYLISGVLVGSLQEGLGEDPESRTHIDLEISVALATYFHANFHLHQ